MAVEHAYLNNGTIVTWFHTQGCIANIRCFLTKNGAQQFFLWRHWAFTLGGDFTHQDVTWLNIGTDINDTRFVQITQRFFADVWNVACDFLWSQFRITGGDFEFFDVDRCEYVITRNAFGNQNRVFVVVTVPRHKRDDHVFTQGQFTHICGRTIGDHFAFGYGLAHLHQRTLVDTCVLVGTLEFTHTIDVNASIAQFQITGCTNNDTLCINLIDNTRTFRRNRSTGIARHNLFDTSPDQWCLGTQQRYRLTLHVGPHQSTVRVVVFQERDQRGRNRYQLFWANVD